MKQPRDLTDDDILSLKIEFARITSYNVCYTKLLRVRFKNLEPSDALKSYVSEKLNRMEKYFNGHAEANVVLSIEKFRHSADINIIGDRLTINGKEETEEMYSAT